MDWDPRTDIKWILAGFLTGAFIGYLQGSGVVDFLSFLGMA